MTDEWTDRFRFDLHASQAIFFVGYSLADLDLRRLLQEEELAEKSFFVLKENPTLAEAHRASRYGLLIATGVEEFAKEVARFLNIYQVPAETAPISHCIRPYVPKLSDDPVEDRQVFELMLSGKLRREYISSAFLGQITYCCIRSVIAKLMGTITPGVGLVFVHSFLGNGKSVAMEQARYALSTRGFEVFNLADRGETLAEELHVMLQGQRHKILFIDNYVEWLDVLGSLRGRLGKDLTLVMSARTASHEALYDRVVNTLAWRNAIEFDLDELDAKELEWVSGFFDTFGLWGDRAASSLYEKLRYLRVDCAGQWSSILIAIFDSPQMLTRLESLFSAFKDGNEHKESLLRLFILTVLGYHPNSPTLITLCGDEMLSTGFREDLVVRELVEFGRNSFNMRSSVMARVILQRIADPNRTVRALIALISQVDKLSSSSSYHYELFKNLVRFSNFHLLFSEETRGRSAMRVYEAVKTFQHCKNNPLFWLQYAIAALVAKDFDRSGSYFKTAYSHAESLDQYDSFQIDNHFARFLIERAVERDFNAADRMAAFREAKKLLRPQFTEEWRHYPYRVASRYFDFYARFSSVLTDAEKAEIELAASEVLDRIAKLPTDRQMHRAVRDCQAAQRKILRLAEERIQVAPKIGRQ